MKRIGIFVSLLAGLAGPFAVSGASVAPMMNSAISWEVAGQFFAVDASDLPWSTVSAVLEAVTDVRPYSYAELVDWYQVGLVTVESVGSDYRVKITDEDGLGDVLIIGGF